MKFDNTKLQQINFNDKSAEIPLIDLDFTNDILTKILRVRKGRLDKVITQMEQERDYELIYRTAIYIQCRLQDEKYNQNYLDIIYSKYVSDRAMRIMFLDIKNDYNKIYGSTFTLYGYALVSIAFMIELSYSYTIARDIFAYRDIILNKIRLIESILGSQELQSEFITLKQQAGSIAFNSHAVGVLALDIMNMLRFTGKDKSVWPYITDYDSSQSILSLLHQRLDGTQWSESRLKKSKLLGLDASEEWGHQLFLDTMSAANKEYLDSIGIGN